MAIGSAATLIIKGGDVREIAGMFCLSLAGVIAAVLMNPVPYNPDTFAGRNDWHGEQAESAMRNRNARRSR